MLLNLCGSATLNSSKSSKELLIFTESPLRPALHHISSIPQKKEVSMKSTKWLAIAAGVAVGTVALAGCSSAPSSTGVPQSAKAKITIWVDDARSKPAQAYAAAHPELHATVQSVDNTAGNIPSKIALATKAGKSVPDLVFLSQPDEISSLLANPVNFPLALDNVVKKSVLDGYASGTISRCTFGGKAYCLPNDLAQTVLYYNKTLFTKFGYKVPATFDDWLALGKKLAVDRPGYSLGSVNGRYGLDAYFGSSQCDFNTSTEPIKVKIDVTSKNCTRVTDVIGPLVANGTLSTLDPFDAAFTPIVKGGKLLATISPSWMGEFGIKPNYTPEGDWAVAPMPTWVGASKNYSGAVGGGIWIVSAKSKNQSAALKFAEALTTDVSIQSKASTYPADKASATAWLAAAASDKWFASDPSAVYTEAAGKVSTTLGYVRYEPQLNDLYNSTILKNAGGDIGAALTDFGTQVTSAAKSAGYTVSK